MQETESPLLPDFADGDIGRYKDSRSPPLLIGRWTFGVKRWAFASLVRYRFDEFDIFRCRTCKRQMFGPLLTRPRAPLDCC
jgi:hypothetical protein